MLILSQRQRWQRRLGWAVGCAVLLAVTATAPALADDPTERQGSVRRSGDDSVELIAGSRQQQPGEADGQGGDGPGRSGQGGDPAGSRGGTCWYIVSSNPFADQITCPQAPPGGQVTRQVVAVPGPDPAVLAQQARDALVLPRPEIHTAPPEVIGGTTAAAAGRRDAVTLFPTWMWVGDGTWGPRSESVSVQGVTVTATATPKQTVWTMGDGTTVVCEGPGTPFRVGQHDPAAQSPSGCDHTYTRSSDHQPDDAYQLSATVSWAVTWTVNGAPGGTLDGFSLTASVPLRVIELQALNQRPDLTG